MDKQFLKTKLKKYLFFISIVFLSVTSIHLIYNFVYFDSKEVPQKWGTISESFVWGFPSLNPLKHNNSYNSYINHILYRSLLNYDINSKKIIWDLMTCSIENTKHIKCDLQANTKWSNWDNITSEDIVSTYETIKKYNTNPVLKSTLDNIEITYSDSSILFKSNIADSNILNIFFQPILPKSIIEKLSKDNLTKAISPLDWIYSWKYKISKVDQDETVWFKKIFLEKNTYYYNNPVYINNITLKFYKDYPSLLQQKENINIFDDKKNLIWNSIPKLKNNKYILNRYVWVFINKDKLKYPNIRNYILSKINNSEIVKNIWEKNNKLIKSPFLNNLELNIKQGNTTIKTMLNSLWYHKKNYYLSQLWQLVKNKKISNEVKIKPNKTTNSWSTLLEVDKKEINITKIKNSITKENYNSDSKIIKEPTWIDKYNFITNPNITLEWISNEKISDIYINNYKLKKYKPKSEKFFYKLSPSLSNIKLWENNYKIYFVENWKKILKEEITIFYNTNKQKLEKLETELIVKLVNEKILETKKIIKKEEQDKIEEHEFTINEKIELNTETIKKQNIIKTIDDKFYYNNDLKPYSLNLTFINWSKEISDSATEIKRQLEKIGIKITITSINNSELQKQIKENNETYNILLAWISLWYFESNLSKYFYSWQIEKWINFSKIRGSKFDSILEDLKSIDINNTDKIRELENSVIKTLERENVFKPIYSPYYSNLILKNIEWYNLPEILPSDIYRFDPIAKSYILKEKIINNNEKNIFWFIKFIINNLF